MKKVLLTEELLAWLTESVRNNVVALDDFDKHFAVLEALTNSSEDTPTVPVEPTPSLSVPTPPAHTEYQLTSSNTFRALFADHVAGLHLPKEEVDAMMLRTPEGHYVLANGLVVKEAPAGFGSCVQIVQADNILNVESFIPWHVDSTGSTRMRFTAVPGSHYVLRKNGGTMELDRFSADIMFAFMHYHRGSMK